MSFTMRRFDWPPLCAPDEAGTPFCVTIDFDTLGEKPELLDTVTIRYRDDGRRNA